MYPQVVELQKQLTKDDPNGKCVPESFVFPVKEGTYDHRVETEGAPEKDVIVAAQCESRGFSVFAMPGCCMPNNHQCGISTDEVMFTFQVAAEAVMRIRADVYFISVTGLRAREG